MKQIYQDINRVLAENKAFGDAGITINGTMFRKLIETAGWLHDKGTSDSLATALQHTVDTATRHYVVRGPQEAVQRQAVIDTVEQTVMADQFIKEK